MTVETAPARRLPVASRGVLVLAAVAVTGVLAVTSMAVGAADLSLADLTSAAAREQFTTVITVSRFPRTAALILAGASVAVAGVLTQLIVRNRFVEPSTIGSTEAAGLALVIIALAAPGAPIMVRMLVAAGGSLVGTGLFLLLLRRLPVRATLLVPVIGLMLSGVIGAASAFLAFRNDLLQTLGTWMRGDFSRVLAGRYELLWIGGALAAACYLLADRLTVVGMGADHATGLGLSYRPLVAAGIAIVAAVTATTVVTVGAIPFVGLIVPNIVRMRVGDHLRRALPWTALLGAAFVLACDIAGRLLIAPHELPLVAVAGVVGGVLFLYLLLRPGNVAGRT